MKKHKRALSALRRAQKEAELAWAKAVDAGETEEAEAKARLVLLLFRASRALESAHNED